MVEDGAIAPISIALILAADLPAGLAANTAAVLGVSIGRRFPIVGPDLPDAGGELHRGLTTVPLPTLKAAPERLAAIRAAAIAETALYVVDITQAAQTTTNYEDYAERLLAGEATAHVYLGMALCGPLKAVRRLSGNLPLYR
jgi:hypothetical protein